MKTVVLISGNGSNLQAIIDANLPITITSIISNKADAYGLQRAAQAGIATHVLSHKNYPNRQTFDQALQNIIDGEGAELVVLAGFMRILSEQFVEHYAGRLINIHPSLLPKYKGLDTHAKALKNEDKEHGATTHFVTNELDSGPIIAQAKLRINPNESEEELKKRINKLEHQLYPYTIDLIATQRLTLDKDTVVFDGSPLAKSGIMLNL